MNEGKDHFDHSHCYIQKDTVGVHELEERIVLHIL